MSGIGFLRHPVKCFYVLSTVKSFIELFAAGFVKVITNPSNIQSDQKKKEKKFIRPEIRT